MVAPQSTTTSDPSMDYTALKNAVIQQLEEVCYVDTQTWHAVVDRYFDVKPRIISIRTRSKLLSQPNLRTLIEILEQRDCLSADNITELDNLANFLRRPRISTDIDQYRQYRKLQGIDGSVENTVCVCRENAQDFDSNAATGQGNCISRQEQEQRALDEAIARVKEQLTKEQLSSVARHLDFREGEIDSLEAEVDELEEKGDGTKCATRLVVSKMFEKWKQRRKREGRNVSIEVLKRALKKVEWPELANLLD